MENFRYKRMGWIDRRRMLLSNDKRWIDSFGYPFYISCGTVAMAAISFLLCILAEWYDRKYVQQNDFKEDYL